MARHLRELALLFLKLGTISIGGPAAHVAMMENEVVQRRRWLTGEQFLDLLGATHCIPGPNAVEMASHVGYQRAGLVGSLVSGLCFSVPAVLISIACAAIYVRFQTLPQVEPFLYGLKAAVLAVIFAACVRLGRKAFGRWQLLLVGVGVAAAALSGVEGIEIPALLVGGLLGTLLLGFTSRDAGTPGSVGGALAGVAVAGASPAARAASVTAVGGSAAGATVAGLATVPLWELGWFFLKIGFVFFGGGYVLVAYIEGGLVHDYGLTQQQLLDAVAVGQLTPGPMLSMVTFVGYLVGGGVPGALVATAGILLPSFFFVAIANPIVPRIRRSRWASRFLDSVNAAAIGLMLSVALSLSWGTLVRGLDPLLIDWRSGVIVVAAAVVAVRWNVAPAWLVLGGAVVGRVLYGW